MKTKRILLSYTFTICLLLTRFNPTKAPSPNAPSHAPTEIKSKAKKSSTRHEKNTIINKHNNSSCKSKVKACFFFTLNLNNKRMIVIISILNIDVLYSSRTNKTIILIR